MKKLSEYLQDLANHAANMEKEVAVAEQEEREWLDAIIKAHKAAARNRQADFKRRIKERQAAVASQWEELQASYNQQVERIRSSIEAKEDARQRNRAMGRADNAESHAEAAIQFAIMALDDAEIATLEAIDAREYAESLPSEKMAAVE